MTDNNNLIDPQDLTLTADEISAKALTFVQSIGTAETEDAEKAMAAKARAYFKRAVVLHEQSCPHCGTPKEDHLGDHS